MTQPSVASSESSHSTSLALAKGVWLLSMRERKLSGGGSTRRGFLIAFHVVEYCGRCAGFTSPIPDFLSLGRGVTKINLKIQTKVRSQGNSKTFALFYSVTNKEYLGQKD